MEVKFKFAIDADVSIVLSARAGKVSGNYVDREANQFALVKYADTTGSVHEQWFPEDELEDAA